MECTYGDNVAIAKEVLKQTDALGVILGVLKAGGGSSVSVVMPGLLLPKLPDMLRSMADAMERYNPALKKLKEG
jgi:hypothetical protein